MKKIILVVLAALLALSSSEDPRVAYIKKYSKLAIKEMRRTGVPASITLAQGILESRSGEAPLAAEGNNHFGIKCHNDWDGKTMRIDDDAPDECFRVYRSAEESYKAHSDFLRTRDRYKFLFDLPSDDYKAWARGLKKAGYATDPAYANKLIKLIEDYDLSYYDRGVLPEMESPNKIEKPKEIPLEVVNRDYKESHRFALKRQIYEQNGVPFVYALEGESYKSIAVQNNLFLKELLKFNDLKVDEELIPGTIVYLARKKAQGPVDLYTVDHEGETLYGISQRFGIRYAVLQRMNVLLLGKKLEPGDTVHLQKKK